MSAMLTYATVTGATQQQNDKVVSTGQTSRIYEQQWFAFLGAAQQGCISCNTVTKQLLWCRCTEVLPIRGAMFQLKAMQCCSSTNSTMD
jgi:hypothetical protein